MSAVVDDEVAEGDDGTAEGSASGEAPGARQGVVGWAVNTATSTVRGVARTAGSAANTAGGIASRAGKLLLLSDSVRGNTCTRTVSWAASVQLADMSVSGKNLSNMLQHIKKVQSSVYCCGKCPLMMQLTLLPCELHHHFSSKAGMPSGSSADDTMCSIPRVGNGWHEHVQARWWV